MPRVSAGSSSNVARPVLDGATGDANYLDNGPATVPYWELRGCPGEVFGAGWGEEQARGIRSPEEIS
ncbi:MAG TPA: hypothetical protein VNC78_01350 [Actinomycetota bacterium]|nr:hypothetical protein [Actinomycetota bacterium]